ncbi:MULTISPECIES: DUF3081 domain-containing protein [Vibrio]|uniref:DUF3081 domain-containing protein n=1 Tax=Vibrio TaxID=662 RepID=UPI000C16C541|nr:MULTISPECIES: DUF3081 domain-containing protein [Vibrio]NAW68177.1 DUF3081 family protein [Vibrio sp. V28_P6S34P95]NAX06397.1 DUF3081 family protein [Vibrio sp. V30_P3S12P165]NAX35060.1 DUF3081 family protein [Vibrio sp. V29_P1S30P107]NAX36194.1 DUF3081 family protein [Vibrio sp. V27_P1S3P104]NAX40330.1 DUF3081 family protein [Vibrio sp. V26_P1S5P106]
MKNELEPSKILQAYESIMTHGTPTEYGKIYQGVEAFSDYDGYTVYMRGNGVELKVGFHNTYHLDYDQEHLRDSFLKKIASLVK